MGVPQVKQKLTITGGEHLTIDGLHEALNVLESNGAPGDSGKLTVNQGPNGWAMFIEWTPEPKPEPDPDWDPEAAARSVQAGPPPPPGYPQA